MTGSLWDEIHVAVALAATFIGALTGVGGGVIIKPAFDLLGHFDPAGTAFLSSTSVLVMAGVSTATQLRMRTPVIPRVAVPLGSGALVGGALGQTLFDYLTKTVVTSIITVVQNLSLALLIVAVLWYMRNDKARPGLYLQGLYWYVGAGMIMGGVSAFLGIGGGPINVAILLLLFSMEIKQAAVYSITTILFSQSAKLLTTVFTGQVLGSLERGLLPYLLAASFVGGVTGAKFAKCMSGRKVEHSFSGMLVLVLLICLWNVVHTVMNT